MSRWALIVLAAFLLITGCQQQQKQTHSESAAPVARNTVRNKPPQRKDVIEAVMASNGVPLNVNSSCANVGTTPGDSTIGAYLSGFLSEFENPAAKNWIETKVDDAKDSSGHPVWRCQFTVRHSAGEDEWGWGVRFDVAQADGRVIAESFVCTGAG